MLSPFIVNDKNLFLDRFPPAQVNRSLQAWDATDEYLINYINEHNILTNALLKPKTFLVFNDTFGAVSLNLTEHTVYSVNDSYISASGIGYNLEQNHLEDDKFTHLTSLDALPDFIDVILFKIPKNKALLIEQLISIAKRYSSNTLFIAGDKAKDIHSSTLALFEQYLGTTTTSLAVKKSRLVFSEIIAKPDQEIPSPTRWPLENTAFTLSNRANVFAREKLDLGARFFLAHLPKVMAEQQVIDLGCGNGVVGLSVLAKQPNANITFYDESYMAVASAKDNITNNMPDALSNCQFIVNDCLNNVEGGQADLVLCNPPFHQQNATTDHIAWQMFKDSLRVLKKGGELRIIGNRQLGYHIKLQRLFGNCTTIASNQKFVVLSAKK